MIIIENSAGQEPASLEGSEDLKIQSFFSNLVDKINRFKTKDKKGDNDVENILNDALKGIDTMYAYCELLDRVKDVNTSRAKKLEQFEIDLFSREVDVLDNYNRKPPSQPRRKVNRGAQTSLNATELLEKKTRLQ